MNQETPGASNFLSSIKGEKGCFIYKLIRQIMKGQSMIAEANVYERFAMNLRSILKRQANNAKYYKLGSYMLF